MDASRRNRIIGLIIGLVFVFCIVIFFVLPREGIPVYNEEQHAPSLPGPHVRNFPVPNPESYARINIESVPSGADIYVDGTWMAITNETIEVKEGVHFLELINPDYMKYSENFTANVSTKRTIRIVLVPVTPGVTLIKTMTVSLPVIMLNFT